MIFLVLVLFSVGLALIRGGRFERLANIDLRYAPLILLGLLIQILIFNPIAAEHLNRAAIATTYNLSILLLLGTLLLNWRLPGALPMGGGIFLNWLVITLNGGFMPASREALMRAGHYSRLVVEAGGQQYNSILLNESTRLPFLADVMAIPEAFPLANVFSVGDVLLALGAAWLIQRAMVDHNKDRDGVPVVTS